MVFAPDAMARESVAAGATRWSAATGCEVALGEEGVPVTALRHIYVLEDGRLRSLCGRSTWDEARTGVVGIEIALEDPACSGEYAATHELGHALARVQGHAYDGVMADGHSPLKGERITVQSLAFVCQGLRCVAHVPEDDLGDVPHP
jgi:hypothetical protein